MSRTVPLLVIGLLLAGSTVGCGDGQLASFTTIDEAGNPIIEEQSFEPQLAAASSDDTSALEPTADEVVDTGNAAVASVSQALLIDDLEDGDFEPLTPAAEKWYWFEDPSNVQQVVVEAPDVAREGSSFAIRQSGGKFSDWGAGLGIRLRGVAADGVSGGVFDASAYSAISFWARISDDSERRTWMHILTPDTNGDGKTRHFILRFDLTTEWSQYTANFADLADRGFDPSEILHIQFQWDYPERFDAWFDDLALVP